MIHWAWILIGILLLSFVICTNVEGFRGRRGRRRGGGGRRGGRPMRRGGRGFRRGGGARRYLHRFRRGYRRPYWGGWTNFWPTTWYPSWLYTPQCREGCGYLGNGVVGCVNPTNSPASCLFASDCYGC